MGYDFKLAPIFVEEGFKMNQESYINNFFIPIAHILRSPNHVGQNLCWQQDSVQAYIANNRTKFIYRGNFHDCLMKKNWLSNVDELFCQLRGLPTSTAV